MYTRPQVIATKVEKAVLLCGAEEAPVRLVVVLLAFRGVSRGVGILKRNLKAA